jgi:hypothetical protein
MRGSRTVRKRVHREFETEDVEQALQVLDSIGEFGTRVQLAAIKLAKGDLQELDRLADIARTDWRDILYWADYPPDAPRTWSEARSKLNLPPGTVIPGEPDADLGPG